MYDIESGRNNLDTRGHGTAHEQFNIPIARDGGIADLLEEAKRPDRRFVAVICESIERVARVSYFSTKIEYELGQAGVALLAADEGVDAARVLPAAGGNRPKKATQVLTRRIKQAISEWYVTNMLELSWDGAREHTRQGWNIGKPPYGYIAERHPHPVKAKRDDGKVKTRLVPDPDRGPVVTQIYQWRALERLGYQDIADRLNLDLDRYPPPEPIPGQGRRAVGAWTKISVREVLTNPKYTGYMVWNRRQRHRPERNLKGKVNPPSEWVWSLVPTHEPLVTRPLFDAATPVGQHRRGSRSKPGPNQAHSDTKRSYLLRSYMVCQDCGRRMTGRTRHVSGHEYIYYSCTINPAQHRHQPWYDNHPSTLSVRENLILPIVGTFFAERILGPHRATYLSTPPTAPPPHHAEQEQRSLRTRLDQLSRAQQNLLAQIEAFQPTGDQETDTEWRVSLQRRFAALATERRTASDHLDALAVTAGTKQPNTHELLASLPMTSHDLTQLPEADQRQLYDAFHLQIRYHRASHRATLRATMSAHAAPHLTQMINTLTSTDRPSDHPTSGLNELGNPKKFPHAVCAPGGSRTAWENPPTSADSTGSVAIIGTWTLPWRS